MCIKSRILDIRKELGLSQLELAEQVGVSRQTIYYLEKGTYNPSLTVSFKIGEVLNKPLSEIFYQVPIIKDYIENLTLKQIKELASEIDVDHNLIEILCDLNDEDLSNQFDREVLEKIAEFLGENYDKFFIN